MVRQLLTTLLLLIICKFTIYSNVLDTCNLSIYATSLDNKYLKLGYYYGSKTFLKDTIFIHKTAETKYENQLHSGIYFLIFPDSSLFEFMIDEGNQFVINVTLKNNSYLCSIKGNPVTEAFDSYQNELKVLSSTLDSLYSIQKISGGDSMEVADKKQIFETKEKILTLKKKYSELFTGSLLSNYINALIPLDIQELGPKESTGGDTDELISKFKFYQKHYLDNVDLNDKRLLYTPILSEKINFYLDKIISQNPDTIASEIERIFNLTENAEVKKFIIENQFEKYSPQKYKPVNEYIYASLIENFYLNGKTPWASTEQLLALTKEFKQIKPTLLFQYAPEIKLPHASNDSLSLYLTNAHYTILFFWEMECPYCTKIIKELNKTTSKYNYLSIKVFTVSLDANKEQWNEFVLKNMPKAWINTIETNKNAIVGKYNITRTPVMYLLDKDKKIINKNFTIPELDDYLLKIATHR
jgi:hypothetical protein